MLGFKPNTLVLMGDYSYKKIQDIQVNEWVISYDEDKHEFVKQIVVDTLNGICEDTVRYTFSDGTVVEGCGHTVFLTTSGYTEEISIGQTVITLDGIASLINKEDIGSQEVYDIDVEDIDNFLAYNVVVHNPPPATVTVTHKVQKDTTSTYTDTVYVWSRGTASSTWAYKGTLTTGAAVTLNTLGTAYVVGFSSSSSSYTPISNIEVSLSSDYIPQPSYTYNADGSVTITSNLTTSAHTETHLVKITKVVPAIYTNRVKAASAPTGDIFLFFCGNDTNLDTSGQCFGILSTSGVDGVTPERTNYPSIKIGLSSRDSSYVPITNYYISAVTNGTKLDDTSFLANTATLGVELVSVVTLAAAASFPAYNGTNKIKDAYVGTNKITKIYIGTTQIYP